MRSAGCDVPAKTCATYRTSSAKKADGDSFGQGGAPNTAGDDFTAPPTASREAAAADEATTAAPSTAAPSPLRYDAPTTAAPSPLRYDAPTTHRPTPLSRPPTASQAPSASLAPLLKPPKMPAGARGSLEAPTKNKGGVGDAHSCQMPMP